MCVGMVKSIPINTQTMSGLLLGLQQIKFEGGNSSQDEMVTNLSRPSLLDFSTNIQG